MNMDLEEQENELLALQSIFSSGEFLRKESESAGEFRVSVELPAGFSVLLNNGETTRQYEVSFLPPLLLTITLPDDYPSSSPPSFTLTCSWLTQSQLMSLSNQLTELYQATGGTVVLFSWMQFLREDALKHLDIHTLLELPSDSSKTPQINKIKQDDDSEAGEQKRNPKSGSLNAQNHLSANLPSGDAVNNSNFRLSKSSESTDNYQKDLSSKAEKPELPGSVSVRQEVVHGVHPNKDPGYSGLSLTPSQMLLSQILIHDADQKQKVFASRLFDCGVCFSSCLGSECVQLYKCGHIFCQACLRDFCKAQITEGNVGGVTCPQPDCPATPTPAQGPLGVAGTTLVTPAIEHQASTVFTVRLACVNVCFRLFFVQFLEGMKALLEDYAKGSKRRRHLLERRYGRKLLLYTIEKHATSMWIAGNTKPCPHCFCTIQKDGGCNHMYCTQCYRPFNWQ
ncbi:E3 ubiquitin-protein ligase RNF14-like [Cyprinodon tularosa]|uniref:E3 ubiquitin-protein ligase RNF14-like n=1 Tax=Cyprinodon tularosa TaxID=77115 RepID=UPI0018E2501D|nr:E3 ubiquitin-protein ligase RNF14-like [Cyprinodon tularosa]